MRAARSVAVLLAAAAVAVPAATAAPARNGAALTRLESGVLGDINAFRRTHHLPVLALSTQLTAAARQHTVEMARRGYFAHESVDGALFWQRIRTFYASSPWHYWSVGENLLWSSPDVTPAHALALWLQSAEHRANLMNPHWREIGVSAVHEDGAPGVFQGLDVTIVTTDFGVRR